MRQPEVDRQETPSWLQAVHLFLSVHETRGAHLRIPDCPDCAFLETLHTILAGSSGHANPTHSPIACWLGRLGSWSRFFSQPPSSPGLRHLSDPPALCQTRPSARRRADPLTPKYNPCLELGTLGWSSGLCLILSLSSVPVLCSVPGPPVLHNTVKGNTYVMDQGPVSLVPIALQPHQTRPHKQTP